MIHTYTHVIGMGKHSKHDIANAKITVNYLAHNEIEIIYGAFTIIPPYHEYEIITYPCPDPEYTCTSIRVKVYFDNRAE